METSFLAPCSTTIFDFELSLLKVFCSIHFEFLIFYDEELNCESMKKNSKKRHLVFIHKKFVK